MKILWIYNQHTQNLEYDHWLHMDFVRYFANTDLAEVKAYGKFIDNLYYDIALTYHKDKTLADIKKEFDFDFIIVNTKGRCFDYYSITDKEVRGNSYLPSDFKDWKQTPKIMIEEDYQYEHNNDWYIEQGFNLILNRHYSNHKKCERLYNIKTGWLPFSYNPHVFNYKGEEKKKKVCFLGNSDHEIYSDRRSVIAKLKERNLIDDYGATRVNQHYVDTLKEYTFAVCGTTTCALTPSKLFEIAACGTIPIINNINHCGIFFLYSTIINSDRASFVSDIENFLSPMNQVILDVKRNSILEQSKKHTHIERIKQLIFELRLL